MSDHVYKKISVVGSSKDSLDGAIRKAVDTAGDTVSNMRWFEVDEIRGHIQDGKVDHFQVSVTIGFTIDRTRG